MWSWESTDTPTVIPWIQWLGSGFGHKGVNFKLRSLDGAAATAASFLKDGGK